MWSKDLYINSIKRIYHEVYKNINQEYITVFLCGGASTNSKCIRDIVRKKLEKKKIRVLYPEDLFMDLLTKNKSMDLLSLENFLAQNSDIICIIPESPGSFVELGAFSNNKNTLEKLFVVINQVYKNEKSFIMTGPIKYITKNNGKNRVIYFNDKEIDDLVRKISIKFKIYSHGMENKIMDLDSIIGQYYFIQLVIYFVKDITNEHLNKIVKLLYLDNNYDEDRFDMTFQSALKFLYKERHIQKNIIKKELSLTYKGNLYVEKIIYNLKVKNQTKLYDSIRYGIIYSKLWYNIPLENTI
ncbi:MAG: retron St85 family effector protein [Intestinibacter bartlettii]|uniref:retron St85 family effector protein n=1 Tax=Intestinibacter bartlettii TaxID=261299 RepID=UPI0039A3E9F6